MFLWLKADDLYRHWVISTYCQTRSLLYILFPMFGSDNQISLMNFQSRMALLGFSLSDTKIHVWNWDTCNINSEIFISWSSLSVAFGTKTHREICTQNYWQFQIIPFSCSSSLLVAWGLCLQKTFKERFSYGWAFKTKLVPCGQMTMTNLNNPFPVNNLIVLRCKWCSWLICLLFLISLHSERYLKHFKETQSWANWQSSIFLL